MSGFTCRTLVIADAAEFLALRQRALREHPEAFHSDLSEWMVPVSHAEARITDNIVFGAFAEGALCGVVMLALAARRGMKLRHKCEIWSVYVAPELRGSGVARALMARAIAEARVMGFEALVPTVVSTNGNARALYESLGFKAYGFERRAVRLADGRTFDDIMMECDLRTA